MKKTVYLYYSSSIAVEVDSDNDEDAILLAREKADRMSEDIIDNLVEFEEEASVESSPVIPEPVLPEPDKEERTFVIPTYLEPTKYCYVAIIEESKNTAHFVQINPADLGGDPEVLGLEDYIYNHYGNCTWQVVEHMTLFGNSII